MSIRLLPIFPLSIVVFPGTPQLLHIFEPRYRQLLADCQEGDRRFGISLLRGEPEAGADRIPRRGSVGCCVVIERIWPLPDGRSNLLAVGERRYVLRDYVTTDRLYRVGVIEFFDDEPADEDEEILVYARSLRAEFLRFASAVGEINDAVGHRAALPNDPLGISFHVAAALDLDLEEKQSLLESRSTRERLRRLEHQLRSLNQEAAERAAVHRRAKGNGRGHPGRPIQLEEQ